ncbi:MAG TPA: hypothetical protein VGF67_02870 [Ktedonobacteraceae bacterium]|jgi:hypothetical protein
MDHHHRRVLAHPRDPGQTPSGESIQPLKAKRARVRQHQGSFLDPVEQRTSLLPAIGVALGQGVDGSPLRQAHIKQGDQRAGQQRHGSFLERPHDRHAPFPRVPMHFIQSHHLTGTWGEHAMLLAERAQRWFSPVGQNLTDPLEKPSQRCLPFLFQPLVHRLIAPILTGFSPLACGHLTPDRSLGPHSWQHPHQQSQPQALASPRGAQRDGLVQNPCLPESMLHRAPLSGRQGSVRVASGRNGVPGTSLRSHGRERGNSLRIPWARQALGTSCFGQRAGFGFLLPRPVHGLQHRVQPSFDLLLETASCLLGKQLRLMTHGTILSGNAFLGSLDDPSLFSPWQLSSPFVGSNAGITRQYIGSLVL